MAICPNCNATAASALEPCPSGDGYYCVDEVDLAQNKGDPLIGRAIGGRFVVIGMLGRGSMAHVYRAQQIEVDRPVALKIFRVTPPPGRSVHDSFTGARERFAQEARVLGKLAHPNCVTLYDYGTDEATKSLYIAMELVSGVSLRSAINRGLRLSVTLSITEQVLLALCEAHSLGVVHRDLKPENIITSFRTADTPTVKVVDFGIAKLLSHDALADMTQVGALFGTPAYMSPEQCRGEKSIGPHSDIYALGCILFEMLAGERPYDAPSPATMIKLHTEAPIPPLRPRPGIEVTPALEGIIHRCLQKDPADRFVDAAAMLSEFSKVRGEVVAAPSSSPRQVVVPANRISGAAIEAVDFAPVEAPPTRPIRQRSPGEATRGVRRAVAPNPANRRRLIVAVVSLVLAFLAVVGVFWMIWDAVG